MIAPCRPDGHPEEPDPSLAAWLIIHSYTRTQAIQDGVLIDLTDWARELGFLVPVACTAAVWHTWIVPPADNKLPGQSTRGRAHDMLWILCESFHKIHYVQCMIM